MTHGRVDGEGDAFPRHYDQQKWPAHSLTRSSASSFVIYWTALVQMLQRFSMFGRRTTSQRISSYGSVTSSTLGIGPHDVSGISPSIVPPTIPSQRSPTT